MTPNTWKDSLIINSCICVPYLFRFSPVYDHVSIMLIMTFFFEYDVLPLWLLTEHLKLFLTQSILSSPSHPYFTLSSDYRLDFISVEVPIAVTPSLAAHHVRTLLIIFLGVMCSEPLEVPICPDLDVGRRVLIFPQVVHRSRHLS